MKHSYFVAISLLSITSLSASADDTQAKASVKPIKSKVGNIVVVSNPIFDLTDPDTFFIHEWANSLHINTLESTTLNNLPFEVGDEVSEKDIAEAQRLLRAEAYIRDAKVTINSPDDPDADQGVDHTVVVETWDNWSLLPTASFGSSGGNTKYSFGIKEDNLLGMGIQTRLKYNSTADRTGYKFAASAPVRFVKHGTIAFDFFDNSDGEATQVVFSKPFYALNTPYMYGASFKQETRVDTIRQNGQDVSEFGHSIEYINAKFGWLVAKDDNDLHRISMGITQDKNTFENSEYFPNAELPQDRDFLYPWLGYEYIQDDFAVLQNVYLISNNEDFNLGWYHQLKLGIETKDTRDDNRLGYHLNWYGSKGYQTENHLLLLKANAKMALQTAQDDFYNIAAQGEYFYHINPKWTAYAKAKLITSQNNYLDTPSTLGDNSGLRGYPNDYQHGDNQWLFTAELRNYPNINLYQLANLGWAVFSDVGHAFGGDDDKNEVTSPIGSVGVGARVYSSKSSYGNVAHIDLAVPFTQGEGTNSWEFRFQVKNHF